METENRRILGLPAPLALLILLIPCIVYFFLRKHAGAPIGGVLHAVDCDGFWLSGWLWNHGYSPYGADFFRLRHVLIPDMGVPDPLSYPPHFWIFAAPLGLVPRADLRIVWGCVNIGLLLAGLALWWSVAKRWRLPATELAIVVLAFLALETGVGLGFDMGQTCFIIWFGYGLLAFGMQRERPVLISVAMALLLLKPHIGLIVFGATLTRPGGLKPAIGAGLLVALASIPPILIAGPHSVIEFVQNLGNYKLSLFNSPGLMSGVGNILFMLGGITVSISVLALLGLLVAGGATALLRYKGITGVRAWLATVIVTTAAIVPFHTYDTPFVATLIILTWRPRGMAEWITGALGLALLLRPENFEDLSRDHLSFANVLTVACWLLLALVLLQLRDPGSPLRSEAA